MRENLIQPTHLSTWHCHLTMNSFTIAVWFTHPDTHRRKFLFMCALGNDYFHWSPGSLLLLFFYHNRNLNNDNDASININICKKKMCIILSVTFCFHIMHYSRCSSYSVLHVVIHLQSCIWFPPFLNDGMSILMPIGYCSGLCMSWPLNVTKWKCHIWKLCFSLHTFLPSPRYRRAKHTIFYKK